MHQVAAFPISLYLLFFSKIGYFFMKVFFDGQNRGKIWEICGKTVKTDVDDEHHTPPILSKS